MTDIRRIARLSKELEDSAVWRGSRAYQNERALASFALDERLWAVIRLASRHGCLDCEADGSDCGKCEACAARALLAEYVGEDDAEL